MTLRNLTCPFHFWRQIVLKRSNFQSEEKNEGKVSVKDRSYLSHFRFPTMNFLSNLCLFLPKSVQGSCFMQEGRLSAGVEGWKKFLKLLQRGNYLSVNFSNIFYFCNSLWEKVFFEVKLRVILNALMNCKQSGLSRFKELFKLILQHLSCELLLIKRFPLNVSKSNRVLHEWTFRNFHTNYFPLALEGKIDFPWFNHEGWSGLCYSLAVDK